MKGYWNEYAYVGLMQDGSWREFVCRKDYEDAYADSESPDSG